MHKQLGLIMGTLVWLACHPATQAAEKRIDFLRDVRPILSNTCFPCHGPDEKQRKAELRLDIPAGAFGERAGTFPFVPHSPDRSEALLRLDHKDPRKRMPPPRTGKSLSDREKATLRAWVEQGASWSAHWAFVKPARPPVPSVRLQGWVRNPIDAFILARLEKEGLPPSPPAEDTTLLRRLHLDLIGLPPSIGETDAYMADSGPDRSGNAVARLLKSPHYGERWARHWLDAARYADSDGYEKDKSRQVWAYRDWVIDALNKDMPYDRFIIEQIAGDLLPGAGQDQRVATGFLRNSMINEEGGVDPEQFRMEAMFDRMDAIGKSILGLTIQCGQCHSHKYDPLTQEEYYRLFAYLNNCHEANIAVYTPAQETRRAELFKQMQELERQLQHRHPNWPERQRRWEQEARKSPTSWTVVRPAVDEISTGGQKYLPLADGSFLAQGYAPTKHKVKMSVRTDLKRITAFRLELLVDPNLPMGGPGRSIKGTAALTEFEVEYAPAAQPGKTEKVKFSRASADVNPPETPLDAIYFDKTKRRRVTGPIAFAIDGKDETAWGIDAGPGRRNQPRNAVFVAQKPIENAAGTILTFYLVQNHGGWNSDDNQNHNLGRFRLSIAGDGDAKADPVPGNVRAVLAIPAERRSAEQTAAVFSYWRSTVPEWREINEKIEALWRQHPEGAAQLVLQERSEPRPTHLLNRGDFLKPGREVSPGVPGFLHALPDGAPTSRLGLARWLVDRNAPTTARSIVNRIWQAYFGTGLVSTSEDLGTQGEAPSHPELLDWLAVEFMERGWSLKELHKLIVSSATYRQSSHVTPLLLARDPGNRLLARGPRLRVEGEIVRDIALSVSGLLNPKIGGPSVHPPAPAFLFEPPASYGPKVWKEATGDDRYRRAIYTFRFRSVPYPMLQTFDAPNGDFSCVRRTRSNTPLQALTALNEPLYLECARGLALRTLRDGGNTDDKRLLFAFRSCLARQPIEEEAKALRGLLDRQLARFSADKAAALQLAASDPNRQPALPGGRSAAQVAAWTSVARVLLNLDETITKE